MANEKMREEFEAFAVKFCEGLDIEEEREGEGYRYYTGQWWEFWKASREELVIELPLTTDLGFGPEGTASAETWNAAMKTVAYQLECRGLKVRL